MLSESVAIADSISSSPVYAPWSVFASASSSQVIADVCSCWGRVVWRRRSAKDRVSAGTKEAALGLKQCQGQG